MISDLRTMARALGGEVIGRDTVVAPGPGHSRRDRSLSVRLVNGGDFLVHSFAGDDPIQCKDFVRARLGLPSWQPGDGRDRRVNPARVPAFDRSALDRESAKRPRTEDDLLRIKRAQALWNEAIEPRGTIAVQYLTARALDLPDELAGAVFRFHPRCPWRNEDTGRTERIPCMIAAFESIDDGTVTAVHRIRVDEPDRWPKTQRRMFGVVHRAAVKLGPTSNTLYVGEGVETCMAARHLMDAGKLERASAWALGSAGAIALFPVLDGVKRLIILGEAGEASARAVRLCGSRWRRPGRAISVIPPKDGCSDLNDEIMKAGKS
jgi:Toprim domain-containing protein